MRGHFHPIMLWNTPPFRKTMKSYDLRMRMREVSITREKAFLLQLQMQKYKVDNDCFIDVVRSLGIGVSRTGMHLAQWPFGTTAKMTRKETNYPGTLYSNRYAHTQSGDWGRSRNSKYKKPQKKSGRNRNQGGQSTYKFVDRARLSVRGGDGGDGCLSHQSVLKSSYKKKPDGGNGGCGGSVILLADPNEQTLSMSRHHYKGQNGANGGSNVKHGRNGAHEIIRVPCGVMIRRVLDCGQEWNEEEKCVVDDYDMSEEDEFRLWEKEVFGITHDDEREMIHEQDEKKKKKKTKVRKHKIVGDEGSQLDEGDTSSSEDEDVSYDDVDEDAISENSSNCFSHDDKHEEDEEEGERERVIVADLDEPGSYAIVANGGQGGIGNHAFSGQYFHLPKTKRRSTFFATGRQGERVHLELELKLIAQLGLVGYPNAGKSTLLGAMSRAKPHIAPYPFTTLHPLVGCIDYRDGYRVLAADVPGLIEGASLGKGRGIDFLRHLERTKALLFIVDVAGVDGRNPIDDLRVLVKELSSYGNGDMMNRPSLVVANKMDLLLKESDNKNEATDVRESLLFDIAMAAEECGINNQFGDGDVLGISAGVTGEGLVALSKAIRSVVMTAEEERNREYFNGNNEVVV